MDGLPFIACFEREPARPERRTGEVPTRHPQRRGAARRSVPLGRLSTRWGGSRVLVLGVGLVAALAVTGCSQLMDPNVPVPLRSFVEPDFGRNYLLYRPSYYDRQYDWPLIVVCHTTFPDSPNRRIRAWTELAESYGFLVAAPTLRGVARVRPPKAEKQIVLQRYDERAILSMIHHIRAGHNISEDRIFLHGWSGGAYAALHTGLRNANVFRALSLTYPKFDGGFLGDAAQYVTPDLPIDLTYTLADAITGKHASHCLRWLRSQGADVRPNPSGGPKGSGMQRCVEFFENVVRNHPWIHIRAVQGPDGKPLEVQFKLRGKYRPVFHRWDFGDGATSTDPEPVYTYREPGDYIVSLTVGDADNREHRRAIRLSVPSGAIEVVRVRS